MANQLWLSGMLAVLVFMRPACGQDLRPILPADSVVVVDAPDPSAALASLLRAVGGLPKELPAEVRAMAGVGLLAVRVQLGGSIEDFVDRVAGGGAAFGLMRTGMQWLPLLVLRPGDLEAATEYIGRLGEQLHHEVQGDLLLISTTALGCEQLRRGLDRPLPSADVDDAVVLRGHVDLAALWRTIPGPDVESLDGGGRFFVSPIFSAFASGKRLDFRVTAGETMRLDLELDAGVHDTPWASLLAAQGAPRRTAPMPRGGILQVAIDRSFGALLRNPKQFLSESDQLGVQSFLSIADLFDGATTSFTDDLIGGLTEPFVFTVLEAEPAIGEHCPLRLPGLVLSAAIEDPRVTVVLRRAAGVIITIINVERAQNGKKPFVLRSASSEHGKGLVAEPPLWRGPGLPPIEDELSPTVLWGHGHFVLASTLAAADHMLAALVKPGPELVQGDRLTLRGKSLARAIVENRKPLELSRMLDEGESQASVERFFDILVAVAKAIERLELTALYGKVSTTITLELERHR